MFQIFEPVRLDFFGPRKIIDIAAGSTYSVFVTERREVFSCGLNDFHQIGIDKTVTVIEKRKDSRSEKYKKQREGQLEFAVPNKLDYFSDNIEVKRLACGENHTLASVDYGGQQLYVGWGMNKHQQLGLEYCISTIPRTIANLQRVPITEVTFMTDADMLWQHLHAGTYRKPRRSNFSSPANCIKHGPFGGLDF